MFIYSEIHKNTKYIKKASEYIKIKEKISILKVPFIILSNSTYKLLRPKTR